MVTPHIPSKPTLSSNAVLKQQAPAAKNFFLPAFLLLFFLIGSGVGLGVWLFLNEEKSADVDSDVAAKQELPVEETSTSISAEDITPPQESSSAMTASVEDEKQEDETEVEQQVASTNFDIDGWEEQYGQRFDIDDWYEANPHPFAKRFNPDVDYMLPRYFISLGPLGIRTLMYDQNWAHRYPSILEKIPAVLRDNHGLAHNAFEILHVHENSPAYGHVQVGDFILGIEEESLKSTQWLTFPQERTTLENRGLEIHAGQLIDRAEGRGAVKLKILRLPQEINAEEFAIENRDWQQRFFVEMEAEQSESLLLELDGVSDLKISSKILTEGHGNLFFDDLILVNKDTGREMSVWDLERIHVQLAWGRIEIDNNTQFWKALAPFDIHLGIPPGRWQLKGDLLAHSRPLDVTISTLNRAEFPEEIQPYLSTVEFEIPQIGSFGTQFDPEGEKARNYSNMLARSLANQQQEDGSWPFVSGYTTQAFYTSMAGLGLLATNDPAYEEHVRKAAHYVAYSGEFSGWSYTRGINAMFLGEYYLRSKDESILPGFALALQRAENNLLVGDIAGHHASPGYDGSGYIGGSGPIACAFAIAEYTPATFTRGTAARMLSRIQSLAIRGSTPYGRATGRSHEKKQFDLNLIWHGQGATAGTAPFYMAAKINGGSKFFEEIVAKRFQTAPYGDADYGHATHTIPFTLGSAAISLCDDQAHIDNLSTFLWKLTTHRGFDGMVVNNANPLEFHSGEGVMGKPWWSTGAYLIMLNAHKRSLAITGHPDYMAREFADLPLVHDADMKAWRQTLRQWSTVEAALGANTPEIVQTAVEELANLEQNENLGLRLFDFMRRRSLACAQAVKATESVENQLKNYCMEMLLGVNHEIYLDERFWEKSEGDKNKALEKARAENTEAEYLAEADDLILEIKSQTFFSLCNGVLAQTINSENPLPEFTSEGKIMILDQEGRPVAGVEQDIVLTNEQLEQTFVIPNGKNIDKLYARFQYQCAGETIDYVRELKVNRIKDHNTHNANLRQIWVPGELVRNYNSWSLHFRLPNGIVYHGYTKTRPFITDEEGVEFPNYILRWGNKSANFPSFAPLVKGHQAYFLVSLGSRFEGLVHEIRTMDPRQNHLIPASFSIHSDRQEEIEENNAYDFDMESKIRLFADASGSAVIHLQMENPVTPTALYFLAPMDRNAQASYVIECLTQDGWQECAWGKFGALQDLHSIVDCPESDQFRLQIQGSENLEMNLHELFLIE